MSTQSKITMKPILLSRNNLNKINVINGYNRLKVLKIIGCNELTPEMYYFTDGSESKDNLKLSDLEV